MLTSTLYYIQDHGRGSPVTMWRDVYVVLGLVWSVWSLHSSPRLNPILALWCSLYMLTDLWIEVQRRNWIYIAHHSAVLCALTVVFFGCDDHVRLQTLEWTFFVEASNPFLSRWIRGHLSTRTFGLVFVLVRLLYMGWLSWWIETSIGDWYAHGCVAMYGCQWFWWLTVLPPQG